MEQINLDSSEKNNTPSSPFRNLGYTFLNYALPILLLIVACFITVLAGTYQLNTFPVEGPWDLALKHPDSLIKGLPYALTSLTILFSHRFGYYILAHQYKIPALLPLFLPGSANFLGGGGAFIRVNPHSIDRKALFDISVSGTIIGFIVALIFLIIGIFLSSIVPRESSYGLQLGEPLVFKAMAWVIHGDISGEYDIVLHPIGLAAWHGLFVVNCFLFPYLRTDGGFLGQALWGNRQKMVNWAIAAVLIILGSLGWLGWFVWLVAVPLSGLLVGKRVPPVINPDSPLGIVRTRIGWGVALIFLVTFMPFPFYFVEG